VSSSFELIRDIVCHDLDPEFIETVAISLAWEYNALYESIAEYCGTECLYADEEFGKYMGRCAAKVLAKAANKHGVPFNLRRLDCNGQHKLLVGASRVVIIQEPMRSLADAPRATEYKRALADTHSLIRQLELDLGDQPRRIIDWSGCILGVLLHGPAGPRFTRDHKSLGGLMLGVPNAAYTEWMVRLDLHDVAMFGLRGAMREPSTVNAGTVQSDHVNVTLKKKHDRKETP
jgi:hypothetical protein